MDFLKKIQDLPLEQRKFILWSIVIIIGIILGYFWLQITIQRAKNIKKEEIIEKIQLPSFETQIGEPAIETEELEKAIEEIRNESANSEQ